MYNRLSLLSFNSAAGAEERSALTQSLSAGGPQRSRLLQATLPGAYNGGDLIWKVTAGSRQELDAMQVPAGQGAAIAHTDSVIYRDGSEGGHWSGPGVYRALLLSVRPSTPEEVQARFEREMLEMPRYITSIKAWRMSRVLAAQGGRDWTHVWEQRYDDINGLIGPYMMHPYHWAWIDRWFDPESQDWIVDTHLCHSFCALA